MQETQLSEMKMLVAVCRASGRLFTFVFVEFKPHAQRFPKIHPEMPRDSRVS